MSNFQVAHLRRLAEEAEVVPAVNQVEVHPYFTNEEVRAYGAEHGILTEAWSPIAQGGVLKDPTITAIASRWAAPRLRSPCAGTSSAATSSSKSTTPSRISENFELFDFRPTNDDMTAISALDQGEDGRTGAHPDRFAYVPS